MVTHARGLVCLALTEARCRQLDLSLMVRNNRAPHGTAFTASIEAATGVSTGISAHDRARTIQVAVARDARPSDIVQPGHIFPLMAQKGGVLVRAGHTEAGCDIAQMAGLEPAAVLCEIMNADGSMARLPQLVEFAARHELKIGTIRDLIHYRAQTENLVECVAKREIVCTHGRFHLRAFTDLTTGEVHLTLSQGEMVASEETLVRVHEPLSALDFIDCASSRHSFSVDQTLRAIARRGRGVIVLLQRKEIGADLLAILRDDEQKTAAKWDPRLYGIGAQILRALGVGKMRLLSSPHKMPSMAGFGLEVCGYLTVEEALA
jgi:3,4-dihydroxy 2-butanone 4-phosphate synthase/GTP cyclohydrolase II